jgi:hypothetical protein
MSCFISVTHFSILTRKKNPGFVCNSHLFLIPYKVEAEFPYEVEAVVHACIPGF